MRFNLRLHGRTADGRNCRAEITVYASSEKDLQREAKKASQSAAWYFTGNTREEPPDGSHITVESVERLK